MKIKVEIIELNIQHIIVQERAVVFHSLKFHEFDYLGSAKTERERGFSLIRITLISTIPGKATSKTQRETEGNDSWPLTL